MDRLGKQMFNGTRSDRSLNNFDSYALELTFDSFGPTRVTAVNLTAEDIEHEVNASKTMQILQKVPLESFKDATEEFTESVVEVAAEHLKLTLCNFDKHGQNNYNSHLTLKQAEPFDAFEEDNTNDGNPSIDSLDSTMESSYLSQDNSSPKTNLDVEPEMQHIRLYKCALCEKSFKHKHHLARHKIKHVEEKAFSCESCGKCFKSRPDLVRHSRLHTKPSEPELSCNKCDKTFTCKNTLSQHLQTHIIEVEKFEKTTTDNVMPYRCEFCTKCFPTQSKLNMHTRSHQENPFFCEPCQKFFSSEENLRKHNLMHSEDRKYKCSICTLGFKKPIDLQRHEAKHNDDKYFFCKFCNKAYTQKYHRDKHEKTHEDS